MGASISERFAIPGPISGFFRCRTPTVFVSDLGFNHLPPLTMFPIEVSIAEPTLTFSAPTEQRRSTRLFSSFPAGSVCYNSFLLFPLVFGSYATVLRGSLFPPAGPFFYILPLFSSFWSFYLPLTVKRNRRLIGTSAAVVAASLGKRRAAR